VVKLVSKTRDGNRLLRDRHEALAGVADRMIPATIVAPPRRLVQIYNGGAMGNAPNLFYLSHPVELDGPEIEGSTGTPLVDTSQSIPVVVLGHVPAVGDILPAFAVGGRWVAERGGTGSQSFPCLPCTIPNQNLTISWVNPLAGNGSDILVYNSSGPTWASGCSGGTGVGNQLLFELLCTRGQIEFRVYYFISGSCPTGQTNYCSNLRANGSQLILSSTTCGSGFTLVFTSTNQSCPTISGSGFSSFIVTL
jgi:hypothetical protein